MKYRLDVDDITYYYTTEEKLENARTGDEWARAAMADAIIHGNKIVKSRWLLKDIFDSLSEDSMDGFKISKSFHDIKLREIAALLMDVADNISNLPVSQEWADKTRQQILKIVDLPEPSKLTDEYMSLMEKLLDAQESNDEALEDDILSQLDTFWFKLSASETKFVEIMVSKMLYARDKSK